MKTSRLAKLSAIHHLPTAVSDGATRIYQAVLQRSQHVRAGNFETLAVADLALMFELYDREFFGGLLTEMLDEEGAGTLQFRLSNRLTSAAGKTFMRTTRQRVGFRVVARVEYEIAVSTYLLFQTFQKIDREVTVGGLICRDRLEALQRIFEHELLHLAEFLAKGTSSCAAAPFHELSRNIFGHAGVVHNLVTPREIADKTHSLRVGARVVFDLNGLRQVGTINRITKRATVLVEDGAGRLFSNGKRYATFYVPLDMLRQEE